MVLRAPHTHLYPGLRLARAPHDTDEGSPALRDAATGCVIEFVDGAVARAVLRHDADGLSLATEAHVTAAGTVVAARRWRLAESPGDDGLRVVRRLP